MNLLMNAHAVWIHLCVCFIHKFLSEVETWCKVCSEGGLPSEMQELEIAIHRHQSLYEQVTQAYTEVNRPTYSLKWMLAAAEADKHHTKMGSVMPAESCSGFRSFGFWFSIICTTMWQILFFAYLCKCDMRHANSFIEAFLLGGLCRCIRYILRHIISWPLFDILVVGFVLQWSPMARDGQ